MEYKFNIKTVCIFNPLNRKEILKKSKIYIKDNFFKNSFKLINVGRLTDQKTRLQYLKQ